MSLDPQIPIWRQLIGHKGLFTKPSLIPLCETAEASSSNISVPDPGHLAQQLPDPTPESTIEKDPSPNFSGDDPTERIHAITIADKQPQPTPESFTNIPAYLMPASTPTLESSPQTSPESWANVPAYLMPASTPALEPLPQTSPESLSIEQLHQKHQNRQKRSYKKRLSLLFAACSIMTIIAIVFMSQGNGVTGAWMADNLRSFVGPTLTAQVESWYLGLSNTASQLQYQVGNKQVNTPWKVTKKLPQHPTPSPIPSSTPPAWSTLSPMPLPSITPLVSPALPGEGVWSVQDNAPGLYSYLPLDAKAFIRPDPSHPYAIVTLLQFDNRFTSLHIVSGTTEPGGPRGMRGTGIIPTSDAQGNALLAAFNGGFKYADGQYGLMTNGVTYVPPQPNAATIAITAEGKLILGAWGVDPQLNSQNPDLVAWRQNAALLINQGVINPLTQDGKAWGGTILNSAYTWRSAIGLTAQGTLLYAAGNALTAETLGEALKAAGAVTAMQTDINPFWVRAFLYERNNNGTLTVSKLNPQMQGTGYEYLYGTQRDFFYLTRFAPAVPPVNRLYLEPTVTAY